MLIDVFDVFVMGLFSIIDILLELMYCCEYEPSAANDIFNVTLLSDTAEFNSIKFVPVIVIGVGVTVETYLRAVDFGLVIVGGPINLYAFGYVVSNSIP